MAQSYNAADYFDKTTIENACDKIDDYARDYRTIGKQVQECADYFTKDALSMDGKTMNTSIEEAGESMKEIQHYIEDFTDSLRTEVRNAYTMVQNQLNEQKKIDEAAAAAAQNASSSN